MFTESEIKLGGGGGEGEGDIIPLLAILSAFH